MKKTEKETIILHPSNQLRLFGYKKFFSVFADLYEKNKLPQILLLSGLKGSGKSTFIYHFINYIFSKEEEHSYSFKENLINKDNQSYKKLSNAIHPNIYCIENSHHDKNINIDEIRKLLSFLNKTTYLNNKKMVIIDNAENLNINSYNALLKSIEEPPENTFFFIIHDSSSKIPETIKSRCTEFKFFFNISERLNILDNLLNEYNVTSSVNEFASEIRINSPGFFLKNYFILKNGNFEFNKNLDKTIFFLMEKYKKQKDYEVLSALSYFIEKFFSSLLNYKKRNIFDLFIKKNQILQIIFTMKKYNLDVSNSFITIENIIKNEAK